VYKRQLYAPAIASNAYSGYSTGIGLVTLVATMLTIRYYDLLGNVFKTQSFGTVPAGAYLGVYSGSSGQPTDANLVAGFVGTAVITSAAGPVAAIVNETGPGGQLSSYDAVPAGQTTLYAPVALNNAYGGYYTGMGIQNTTTTIGTVKVTYYDSSGVPTPRVFPIAGNGYLGVYQGDATQGPAAPGAYTATIMSTVPVAAIVNEVAPGSGSARQSTAYNTFATGSASLHLPLVESAGPDGLSTGEGIMNTGSAATVVIITYFDPNTGAPVGTPASQTLAPNAFWGVYQPTSGLPNGTRASAIVSTQSGGQVAVICNESNATSFMSYDGQ